MTDQAQEHPTEIELKLLFPPEERARLEQHPLLQPSDAAPPEERHQLTTYYDTPDFALAGAGISLRVRRSGERRVQTVKSRGDTGGAAARRGEWEWPVENDRPDLGLLADTGLDACADSALAGRLEPVFVSDVRRTQRLLRIEEDTLVEAALDEGSIKAGDAAEPVRELELELKGGSLGALYRLARDLHTDVPAVRISADPKAARGYRLRTGRAPEAEDAALPELDAGATAADGLRRIVAAGLGQLLANQAAAEVGEVEGVHQMRVALRRLRAALVLFKPCLAPHAGMRFTAGLRHLGRVLGEARDWDVFCLETLPALPGGGEDEEPWHDALRQAAEAARSAAHAWLREELAKPDLTGLVLDMAAWAEESASLPAEGAREPLSALAPALLDRVARQVAKRGKHLGRRSPEELHALRKSFKKLRYGVEYLAGLYPHRTVKAYLKRCRKLQKRLGEFNDAAVAADLAETLSLGRPDLRPAADAVARWSGKRCKKALGHLAAGWDEFRGAEPFWR